MGSEMCIRDRIMAMAVLWMAGVQVVVSRFLHGTEPDLFPVDDPLDDPSESPMS